MLLQCTLLLIGVNGPVLQDRAVWDHREVLSGRGWLYYYSRDGHGGRRSSVHRFWLVVLLLLLLLLLRWCHAVVVQRALPCGEAHGALDRPGRASCTGATVCKVAQRPVL